MAVLGQGVSEMMLVAVPFSANIPWAAGIMFAVLALCLCSLRRVVDVLLVEVCKRLP